MLAWSQDRNRRCPTNVSPCPLGHPCPPNRWGWPRYPLRQFSSLIYLVFRLKPNILTTQWQRGIRSQSPSGCERLCGVASLRHRKLPDEAHPEFTSINRWRWSHLGPATVCLFIPLIICSSQRCPMLSRSLSIDGCSSVELMPPVSHSPLSDSRRAETPGDVSRSFSYTPESLSPAILYDSPVDYSEPGAGPAPTMTDEVHGIPTKQEVEFEERALALSVRTDRFVSLSP